MAEKVPRVSSQGLSRRSFLVAMGTAILGSFVLPGLPAEIAAAAAAEATPVPDALPDAVPDLLNERVAARLRRLLTRPVKSKGGKALAWMEAVGKEQKVRVMAWYPETEEELAEANRFYEIATWRSWKTLEELQEILRQPGPWLLRRNDMETYLFVTTDNENALSREEAGKEVLTDDPREAARLTSEQALRLIPPLMDRYGNWDKAGGHVYFEPVRPEDAWKSLRALKFKESLTRAGAAAGTVEKWKSAGSDAVT